MKARGTLRARAGVFLFGFSRLLLGWLVLARAVCLVWLGLGWSSARAFLGLAPPPPFLTFAFLQTHQRGSSAAMADEPLGLCVVFLSVH